MLLTAQQLSERPGWPARRSIYAFAKTGRLPAPVDMTVPVRSWVWSSVVVEQYESGEWRPPLPPKLGLVAS